jgi:RHS repeat-associated protein
VNGGEQLRSVRTQDAAARDAEARSAPRAVEAHRPAVRAEATRNAFRSPTTTSGEPKRRFYIYTPELHLLAETELTADATPEMEYEYVWFGGEPVAQIETGTGAVHYYFNDHLGTPILTTDTTGVVDWRVEREPYGEILEVRAGADRHQPLAFPGQEEDGGEIAYNIFRWYRAGWGRYTQADPIEPTIAIVTTNMYSYALANPYGNTDPLGLFTVMSLASPGQRKLIEDAMKLLRDEMAKHPCADCKSYFAAQTHPDFTDIDVWSQPGGPPYVQVIPRPSNAGTARAHTQSGGSFLWTWLYTSNFPPSALMPCDLASLILHEAGHLSRKDTTDNEPPDFFTKCKFGCINPGKWH